jgi:glycolate oxidase
MPLKEAALKHLRGILGPGRLDVEIEGRACNAYDATGQIHTPDAVAYPETKDEIAAILRLANAMEFPVAPRGAGTGMTGGCLAVQGGLVLSTARMRRVVSLDPANMVARVEPGVVCGRFQEEVEAMGLFYPPDPSSAAFSTLGGNVAECAGGPRAVKYGVTRDYVLGLEAVTGAGACIRCGVQTAKGVVGYDLTRLITGSEGTLAVITQITLRLLPKPASTLTMTAVYDSVEDAARTVSAIFQAGIVPCAIEYLDQAALVCAEDYMRAGLPTDAGAVLLLAADGSLSQTREDAARLEEVCRFRGARAFEAAGEKTEKLWAARKSLSPALFRHGPHKINEDIVVPRSRIPEMVRKINEIRERTGLVMVTFGHAGDGNMHVNIMLDKNNPGALEKADKAVDEVFALTLALGGTISGEHGVGATKMRWFGQEIHEEERALMLAVKRAFDPKGILNPGKIFG